MVAVQVYKDVKVVCVVLQDPCRYSLLPKGQSSTAGTGMTISVTPSPHPLKKVVLCLCSPGVVILTSCVNYVFVLQEQTLSSCIMPVCYRNKHSLLLYFVCVLQEQTGIKHSHLSPYAHVLQE